MLSCAAIQKLERYGALGLKRHSVEDFVAASLKDMRRSNIYALTLKLTWREAVQAMRGDPPTEATGAAADADVEVVSKPPVRYTDELVYALSFAVALTTQHLLESRSTASALPASSSTAPATSGIFVETEVATAAAQALDLLTTLKDMAITMGNGGALSSNVTSDAFTKAAAHLLTSCVDLVLVLFGTDTASSSLTEHCDEGRTSNVTPLLPAMKQHEEARLVAQALVLVAAAAQMLRRVQRLYPLPELYHTRPCGALLRTIVNKWKQQRQQRGRGATSSRAARLTDERGRSSVSSTATPPSPLLELLQRYVQWSAAVSPSLMIAAGLFTHCSLFQRLAMLHGVLAASTPTLRIGGAGAEVQHWLSLLLASIACNRATRYAVYYREDELRLLQNQIRQPSEYALFTFTTTPPVEPGLIESLLGERPVAVEGGGAEKAAVPVDGDALMQVRAALTLAQWCASAPFFFESFCLDESWGSFAQEQRRLVLLQYSRQRRGLEKTARKQRRTDEGMAAGVASLDVHAQEKRTGSRTSSRSSSVDSAAAAASSMSPSSEASIAHRHDCDDTASHRSFQTDVGGSVTSLASRASLLSTFSQHSAASYLSFLSVLRPSKAGSLGGGGTWRGAADNDDVRGDDDAMATQRQMHESEDGNTNLPLILLEQLMLGLQRFMEAYPAELLDRYGLRNLSWSCIARMLSFVEASLPKGPVPGAAARVESSPKDVGPLLLRRSHCQPNRPLFSLAHDVRYNKGMGYECLGLLFAKVMAPLLDRSPQPLRLPTATMAIEGATAGSYQGSSDIRSEEHASAYTKPVGRAVLLASDDEVTRHGVEAALSTCLSAYEAVAPQVVDINLSTIVCLVARTARRRTAAAAVEREETTNMAAGSSSSPSCEDSWSSERVSFLCDIVARLGRSNDLVHLIDALLSDGAPQAVSPHCGSVAHRLRAADTTQAVSDDTDDLIALLAVPSVQRAVMEAAGASLDPESLLAHLSGVLTTLTEGEAGRSGGDDGDAGAVSKNSQEVDTHMRQLRLALMLTETLLRGVAPTSVSASAVLEQTTQMELLLTASCVRYVRASVTCEQVVEADEQGNEEEGEGSHSGGHVETLSRSEAHLLRAVAIAHLYTIRQCRAVTVFCLQDLGTQQVQDYLLMLEEALWQVTNNIGDLLGPLKLAELQQFLQPGQSVLSSTTTLPLQQLMLLPSLVLQRLSLARVVSAALDVPVEPFEDRRAMVAYLWMCLGGEAAQGGDVAECRTLPLLLASTMTPEDWKSLVTLGKEKHARTAMVALLHRSMAAAPVRETAASFPVTLSWVSCCLTSIPGTVLRALVHVFVSCPIDDISAADSIDDAAQTRSRRQWMGLLAALVKTYTIVGHNPYWPSLLTHTVRCLTAVARTWSRQAKERHPQVDGTMERGRPAAHTALLAGMAQQLLSLLICLLHSEPHALETLHKLLLTLARETATITGLSRSGMAIAYVEAIKIPAATLSDLSVPVPPAAAIPIPAGAEEEGIGWSKAATQGATALPDDVAVWTALTYEEELRDGCARLFAPSFARQIFMLAALLQEGEPRLEDAVQKPMRVVALLYQTCVWATQAAWRAGVADGGGISKLDGTLAVRYLLAVTECFHSGCTAASTTTTASVSTAALQAFLGYFHGDGEAGGIGSGGGSGAQQRRLFPFIPSSTTVDRQHRRKEARPAGSTATVAENTTTTALAAAEQPPSLQPSVLMAVEAQWCSLLRHTMRHLLMQSTVGGESAPAARWEASSLFRQLFSCVWASVRPKLQQRTKVGGRSACPKGLRHVDTVGKTSSTTTGALGTAELFVTEVLLPHPIASSCSDGATAEQHAEDADIHGLRRRLATFWEQPRSDRAGLRHFSPAWERMYGGIGGHEKGDGVQEGVCAWWLLWLCGIAAALPSATTQNRAASTADEERGVLVRRARSFLSSDGVRQHRSLERVLQGVSLVMQVLPSEEWPPLFHWYLDDVLTEAIPASASPGADPVTVASVAAAATQLLLRLFSFRPRLPSSLLLPHAQRAILWLSHPSSRTAGVRLSTATAGVDASGSAKSLASLAISLAAAVAAHPAVFTASRHTGRDVASYSSVTQSTLPGHALEDHARNTKNGAVVKESKGREHNPAASARVAAELLDNVWLLLLSLLEKVSHSPWTPSLSAPPMVAAASRIASRGAPSSPPLHHQDTWHLHETEVIQLILLLTRSWLGRQPHQQILWSRSAMVPLLLSSLFSAVMRGMERQWYRPRVLNVLAGGLAAVAAHVDAATAAAGDEEPVENDSSSDSDDAHTPSKPAETRSESRHNAMAVPAHVKRAALAATTVALFEVAQHHVNVFTRFSTDVDFLCTDVLRVLRQHFLPRVTRPPVAHRAGVHIGGSLPSENTFADLAYLCVGNMESKSLLKQAALRMDDSDGGSGGGEGSESVHSYGSRSIFRVT